MSFVIIGFCLLFAAVCVAVISLIVKTVGGPTDFNAVPPRRDPPAKPAWMLRRQPRQKAGYYLRTEPLPSNRFGAGHRHRHIGRRVRSAQMYAS